MSHTFCTLFLKETRKDARPALLVDARHWYVEKSDGMCNRPYYWVKAPGGSVVWEGGACCAYEARARALEYEINRDPTEWMGRP